MQDRRTGTDFHNLRSAAPGPGHPLVTVGSCSSGSVTAALVKEAPLILSSDTCNSSNGSSESQPPEAVTAGSLAYPVHAMQMLVADAIWVVGL
ncbi:hypothetical protein ABBQ38_008143 [Trebouxia sp. C0009 RCD-2024]